MIDSESTLNNDDVPSTTVTAVDPQELVAFETIAHKIAGGTVQTLTAFWETCHAFLPHKEMMVLFPLLLLASYCFHQLKGTAGIVFPANFHQELNQGLCIESLTNSFVIANHGAFSDVFITSPN